MPRRITLLIGHGSRRRNANAELRALAEAYAARHPAEQVATAFIELERPTVDEAIDALAAPDTEFVLAPIFLFAAGHIKNDLPLLLDAARWRHPNSHFLPSRPLGSHPELLALACERALESLDRATDATECALLVVGRGSSDPDANSEVYRIARLIGEGGGFDHVEAAFMGVARPSVQASLERFARTGAKRIVVLPYLLFGGRLIEKLRDTVAAFTERYRWIDTRLAWHLGTGPRLLEALEARIDEAREGDAPLPCDLCQYRSALPGLKDEVGGLRALLYSVRHSFTHAQASMPEHTHRPLKKHILVCTNADCLDRGSLTLVDALRAAVKASGNARSMRVTRTSCMGRCGGGPTVAIYPDGIWYRRVQAEDAREIVEEHLLGDRLVGRLIDDILQ